MFIDNTMERVNVGLANKIIGEKLKKLSDESGKKTAEKFYTTIDVSKLFKVGKVEDFNGKLSSVLSPSQIQLLNNNRAVTQSDVIEAMQGELKGAQFDYVINAVGELLGLPAKELILKLCK